MEYEEAKRLCDAVNSYAFVGMGLQKEATPIGDATLADLVEAARVVREHPGEKTDDGMTRHHVYPADELIAEVYLAWKAKPIQTVTMGELLGWTTGRALDAEDAP